MAYSYIVYDLRVLSSGPIPGLREVTSEETAFPADVRVHWGAPMPGLPGPMEWKIHHQGEPVGDENLPVFTLHRLDGSVPVQRLRYMDGVCFWLRSSPFEIWATWPDHMTPGDASAYLLGPVLGYVLRLRGTHALHASAVSVPVGSAGRDKVVAFAGPPGAGKSTVAAAFAVRGQAVLSEDVCALREGEPVDGVPMGELVVLPGYPLVRLWPCSTELLFGHEDALPRIAPDWEKRYLDLGHETPAFCDRALPLHAVFLLEPGEEGEGPWIKRVRPSTAMVELVGNTYKNDFLDRAQREAEFEFLHRLLQTIPVFRARRGIGPESLEVFLDMVLEFVRNDADG